MTDFNASGVILSLDEYFEQCVVPKPRIPPRYSSNAAPKGDNRQLGHLQTYKDQDQGGDTDVEVEDFQGSVLANGQSILTEFDSNVSQINFEINDFGKVYCETESQSSEASQGSATWRMNGNNVNRPSAAAQLGLSDQARGHVKSRLDLREGSRFRNNFNKRRNRQYNHHERNEFHRHQHQPQIAKKEVLRYAYNAFSSQEIHSNQQTDLDIDVNKHFQYTHQAPTDPRSSRNYMGPDHYDWTGSTSIGSLIDSVSHIPDNRVKNHLPCETITRYTDNSMNVFAGEAQDINKPQTDLKPAAVDSESMKISKMAHNVMLLLKSVAQQNNQGDSCDIFKNIDWINGPMEESRSVALLEREGGRDQLQRFN
uniref:RE43986p n=1 Tax=Drosophila melanogaster TaxID=7227 RepID=Q8MYZ0_DROME|nr:RE43986p [Drosophila melanogaster]